MRLKMKTFGRIILLTALTTEAFGQHNKEGDTCTDKHTNSVGVCMPSEKCLIAKTNYEKSGIVPTFCQYSPFGNSLVCCRDGRTVLQMARPRTVEPLPVWDDPDDKRRISEKKCEAYSRQVTLKVNFSPLLLDGDGLTLDASKCSYTNVELIIGGEDARQGEFPHMAAIGWANFEGGYTFSCGGSLISPRFVLSAAHCNRDPNARDPRPVVVRLGDQNIDTNVKDGANPVDVPIRSIHTHPGYVPPLRYNDIAIFELASEVEPREDMRPACLWTRADFGKNNKAIATGWGVMDTVTRETSKELKKVSLSLLDSNFCDPLLEYTRNRNWNGLVPEQLCAGELRGGKDTCQGDSGSPLQVSSVENRCLYYIMGITSFGKQCASADLPAIYTRVSSYLDWIEGIVWPGE